MKHSWRGVIYLGIVLFCNIAATQQTVNAFFFQKYRLALTYAIVNLALFPLALWIYRRERDKV